jgi:hypothetical protein
VALHSDPDERQALAPGLEAGLRESLRQELWSRAGGVLEP